MTHHGAMNIYPRGTTVEMNTTEKYLHNIGASRTHPTGYRRSSSVYRSSGPSSPAGRHPFFGPSVIVLRIASSAAKMESSPMLCRVISSSANW